MIKKYSIKKVPTILILGETSAYKNLGQLWSQVGIVSGDGSYIFTKTELMGIYKDLSTNKIINPQTPTTTPKTTTKKR